MLNQFHQEISFSKITNTFRLHPAGVPLDVKKRLEERALAANNNFIHGYITGTVAQDAVAH